jgi:hypothetical protein
MFTQFSAGASWHNHIRQQQMDRNRHPLAYRQCFPRVGGYQLRVDSNNAFVHRIIARIFHLTPKQLRELSVGTLLYAGSFTTEGL